MSKIFTFSHLFLAISLIAIGTSKIIQIPPVSLEDSIALRLDQKTFIDSAFKQFGNLTRIYRKQVSEIVGGSQVQFPTCSEEQPWAKFWGKGYQSISNNVHKYGIIYDFQQIKYSRNLIDLVYEKGKVYYMLENGLIKIAVISQNFDSINQLTSHQTSEVDIAKGHFVILASSGYGLFINQNLAEVFSLSENTFNPIKQYEKKQNYESAIALENNYFAVAYGQQGMRIYSLNPQQNTLKLQAELNQDSFNLSSVNFKDLAYDSTRKILFIVDYNSGVVSLQITYDQKGLTTKFTSSPIQNKLCNLVYYDSFNDELYLGCRQLRKFRINNWPIFDEKVLPRQDIAVRQITSSGPVVALVGRDVFQILVADRKAAIYEDKLMDKLVLINNHFISANENGILIGQYALNPPLIACSTADKKLLGNHRLMLKVVAECNEKYLKQIGFDAGPNNNQDKCIYTVYQNMTIWEPAIINTTPFMVIGILLGLLGLGVLVWWGLSYLSFRKLKSSYDNYQNLQEQQKGSQTEQDKHKQNDNRNKSVSSELPPTDEKLTNPVQVELQNEQHLHDIQ